jgi:DNA polymerase-3 subunit alpha
MWASLHNHTHQGSLLDGLSKPIELIARAVETEMPAIAISDHGSCAGLISFQKAQKKYIEKHPDKAERAKVLKLILGCEMYIADSEKKNSHLVVLAKNKLGYKQLIKAVSEATRRENFYRKPRLTLDQLNEYTKDGNLVSFNGHPGSSLNNILWLDLQAAFNASTYEEAKALVRPDWKELVVELAGRHREIFGKDNFFIEIQRIDEDRLPMETISAKALQWLCRAEGYLPVATADSHYPTQNRAEDQRILLCSSLHTTLPKVRQALANNEEVGLGGFFKSNKYYLPSPKEMSEFHTEEELANSLLIADMCEAYDLSSKPIIPAFACPNNLTSDEYLKQLCREGWKEKIGPKKLSPADYQMYGERVRHELGVLQGAGLSDYFLLIKDILDFVKGGGGFVGEGRGSVAGSLASYLLGITAVDPIPYNLIFERFYNAGRNSPGRVSLPDIDMDIQASYIEKTINYIKDKYGNNKVAGIATYGRLMGRGCLSEVLRVHDVISFDEIKKITRFFPDESAIAGELEEMKDEEDEASIILWSLINNKKELKEWCFVDDKNELQGPLATYFAQAIRLEGTYKSSGEHAAGVVIFPEDITEVAPVVYDKNGDCKIAYSMYDIEHCGGVKMDVLSVKILDRIADAQFDIQNNFLRSIDCETT